jgi:hypothetical protein
VGAERAGTENRNGAEFDGGLRVVFLAALAAGVSARLVLAFLRPLWADEVFTLTLAYRGLPDLLAALRLDSGPPLHYLAAKLVLLPFGGPGPFDVIVRLLSVAASLLHVPLFVRIGRRCGSPRAGLGAAALFLLFPLAVASGAEGRGYALASLLALAAFERLLALEGAPRGRAAVLAGLLGGAAVLTHYLALLPVAGMLLVSLVRVRPRRAAALATAIAAALAASWLPVALRQPRASMAWAEVQPLGERTLQFVANLGLGLPADAGPARFLGPLAFVLLAAALLGRRGTARVPAAAPLLAGLALLAPLLLFSRAALLPDRTALVYLPFVSLVLASARSLVPLASGPAAAAVLAASLPVWLRPTPAAQLAATLEPRVRAGARVVASELWGPELDYRLARRGLAGRVALFPSDVARHPGWYEESGIPEARLAAEAGAVVRSAADGTFFVFSPPTRAGRALGAALDAKGGLLVAAAGPFEVWIVAARGAGLGSGPSNGGPP